MFWRIVNDDFFQDHSETPHVRALTLKCRPYLLRQDHQSSRTAVNLSGHPERGRSLSLSITFNSGSLFQRVIHFMTVFFNIPSSDAMALSVSPSSSCKTIRAQSTFACDDFRLAIILLSFIHSSSVKINIFHFVVLAYFTKMSCLNIGHELQVSRTKIGATTKITNVKQRGVMIRESAKTAL
jgi:hypothetical protein